MKKTDIKLRPIHYASVSGGKDSLYMLLYILEHRDKYPCEMVVHFETSIDWEWANKVVDAMEQMCKAVGIRFLRIRPRKTWEELYAKYGFPTRLVRWCNEHYKLDCERQLKMWIRDIGCRPVAYVGFCADETKRFKYQIGEWEEQDVCYPLAEEGITEPEILAWAKEQPLLKDWYRYFDRQGCKFCPMIKKKELAYMYLFERESFEQYFKYAEEKCNSGVDFWNHNCPNDVMKKRIIEKWVPILEEEIKNGEREFYDIPIIAG